MKKLKKSISFPIENKNLNDNNERIFSSTSFKEANNIHVLVVDDDEEEMPELIGLRHGNLNTTAV